ncbi:fibronectin type III domain-containing protein [Candidatus Microgenomates bacterium]|nr:fibronectin type III domain-containing protein [Candidatus Microgenomates bacterium]
MRKIPTLLGIFLTLLLVAGLAVASSQVQKVTKLWSSADQSVAPTAVGVGNITDSGLTVFWTTGKEVTGAVFWGKTANLGDGVAVDDRDLTNPSGKYLTHFVRVTGLSPSQKYYFKVSPGDEVLEASTKASIEAGQGREPIFGKVVDSAKAPAAGVLISLETARGKLVALSKTDGTFVLPLLYGQSDASETITFTAGTGEKATIICQPGLDRPLPEVKLGQDGNCFAPPPSVVASPSGEPMINITEGETVSSPLPTISGQAGPNQIVKIEVHSETAYTGTVKADPAGNWSWTPPANLSAGIHTVTITIVAADGTTSEVSRTFYVASGEQILPVTSGTPSAVPTHRTCFNQSCSQIEGEGADTCSSDSDCVVTQPVTPPTPPVTGRTSDTLLMLTAGVISATLGLWIIRRQP